MTAPVPDFAEAFDVVVVGGGPAGATAAAALAARGRSVALVDRAGRIKPCGGAIPPRLVRDFTIPDELLCARIDAARMVSPKGAAVDMPIAEGSNKGGYVGIVDREHFDEWLRERAANQGARRVGGTFTELGRDADGMAVVRLKSQDGAEISLRARAVVGADGANSAVGRQAIPGFKTAKFVFAYHEIVEAPVAANDAYAPTRCDIYYDGTLSPDFYSWVFPHGRTMSIGTGSARKGFSLRGAIATLRQRTGMADLRTLRREGAPIPLKPMRRWDNGRDVILVGDAAGVVAPASGEGIYYAMASARYAVDAVEALLATGDVRALRTARKRFMKKHGMVFLVLGIMQYFWYGSDRRREKFVAICRDKDVQELTWTSYMNKELVRRKPVAHIRIFFKDLGQLVGIGAH